MGYAFVTGAIGVLGLWWTIILIVYKPLNDRRQPQVAPLLSFTHPNRWTSELKTLADRTTGAQKSIFPSTSAVDRALDDLLAWILRDFVAAWYTNISSSPAFLVEIDSTIRSTLITVGERLNQADLVELVVSRFVPIITRHLQSFIEAEKAVRGRKLDRDLAESEELDLAVAANYKNGKLHAAGAAVGSESRLPQKAHLRAMCEEILPLIMPSSQVHSKSVMTLVREILSCSVLSPVFQMLSDGDTWNQVVEVMGRDVIQDRRTVRKLRAALDEHASPPAKSSSRIPSVSTLHPYDSDRRFEQFIRSIRHCNDIDEARRWRDELGVQFNCDSHKVGTDAVYLRRLETCRKLLDRKVLSMSDDGLGSLNGLPASRTASVASLTTDRRELQNLLRESKGSPGFKEFMSRRGFAHLIQSWLLIEGMRGSRDQDRNGLNGSLSSPSAADYEELLRIIPLLLNMPGLQVSFDQRAALSSYEQAGSWATNRQYSRARSAVHQVQTAVYEEMNKKHLPQFCNTDLLLKLNHTERNDSNNAIRAPALGETKRGPSEFKQVSTQSRPDVLRRSASTQSFNDKSTRKDVLSNSGLLSGGEADDNFLAPRRISTDSSKRRSLFGEDEDDAVNNSTLTDGVGQGIAENPAGAVKAMERALTGIMAEAERSPTHFSDPKSSYSPEGTVFSNSEDTPSKRWNVPGRPESTKSSLLREPRGHNPTLSSLGLVNKSIRIGVFSDSDLFPDDEVRFAEDERTDNSSLGSEIEDDAEDVQPAAPGDLGLSEAISTMNIEIRRLVAQEAVLDSLVKKAELVNNAAEIRILGKSKSSLAREIKRKELQRQQYTVQEGDSGLFGRSNIQITSTIVGQEENGHEYALYVIEVQRWQDERSAKQVNNGNGAHSSSEVAAQWAVARRYSEFHALHRRLRQSHAAIRDLEFPRRKVVARFGREFLEKRRRVLEAYLRQLLQLPDICRSRDFRAFLSEQAIPTPGVGDAGTLEEQRQDLISRLFQTVSSGVEDVAIDFPVLEHLSMSIPLGVNMSSLPSLVNPTPSLSSEDPKQAAEAEAELSAFQSQQNRVTDGEPFIKPICDLFLELFDLNSSQSWLRGRAVVLVLHQLLGGTIERRIREQYIALTSPESLIKYIDLVKTSLWDLEMVAQTGDPAAAKSASHFASTPKKDRPRRTLAERTRSRVEANILVQTLIPDLAGGVVGRANAKSAARKLHAALNNGALMEHLVFSILDEAIGSLFGEEAVPKYDVKGQLISRGRKNRSRT